MRALATLFIASLMLITSDKFVRPISGQSEPHPATAAARAHRQKHEQAILAEFIELLALPNVASDTPNIRRNAALIRQMLDRRGVRTQLLEVGSSRVDLQACKLEYSIVSPK